MRRERVLSCYALGRQNSWEAICLDLDIAVQGDSFGDVSRKLREAISAYVEYVLKLPEADQTACCLGARPGMCESDLS